jgi:type II secretory pathway component PulL
MSGQRWAWWAIVVAVLLSPVPRALADPAAAQACAAQLPKDAQTIFAAALPQLGPGADLRGVVTDTTRSLARDNRIDRATARPSAVSAAKCLGLAAP